MNDDTYGQLQSELDDLNQKLQNPAIYQDPDYPALARQQKLLQELVELRQQIEKNKVDIEQTKKLLDTPELQQLASEELNKLQKDNQELIAEFNDLINPQDQSESRNCLIEIRAGVGGSEASLFVADLYRMYIRYSDKQKYQVELISCNQSEVGGYKEIIFGIKGKNVYQQFRFESGVHRVQRIPTTESQGRIHTSTVSVAVLLEANEVDIDIKPEDIRIDTYRASGHGGQSVNKTDSAVRITHLPTGIVATSSEKSQFRNKEKALAVLRARLYQEKLNEQNQAIDQERQQMVGKAFRNEKIRTYNFPQDRLTDHRINLSLSNLNKILDGDLKALIEKLSEGLND